MTHLVVILYSKGRGLVADKDQITAVQFADTYLQKTALGVFVLSSGLAFEVVEYLANPDAHRWIKCIQMGISAGVVLLVLPAFIRYIRYCRKFGRNFAPEGYVTEMFRRACARSFEVTFIFLTVAEVLSHRGLPDVPAKIFLDATLFISLMVMSLTLLKLAGASDEEDDFDDEMET